MQYEATDRSGQVWWYRDCPVQNMHCGIWVVASGDCSKEATRKVADLGMERPDWANSLRPVCYDQPKD